MIWLLLAFAVYPASMGAEGAAGNTVDLALLMVGDETVRVHTTRPLELDNQIPLTHAHHLTLTARIHANTPPGNYTSYLYVEPLREDSVVIASAIPIRVAVHENKATRHRIIPNHANSHHGLWAALGGVITAIIGLAKAISVRRG